MAGQSTECAVARGVGDAEFCRTASLRQITREHAGSAAKILASPCQCNSSRADGSLTRPASFTPFCAWTTQRPILENGSKPSNTIAYPAGVRSMSASQTVPALRCRH
jgi:hypothetical protein